MLKSSLMSKFVVQLVSVYCKEQSESHKTDSVTSNTREYLFKVS